MDRDRHLFVTSGVGTRVLPVRFFVSSGLTMLALRSDGRGASAVTDITPSDLERLLTQSTDRLLLLYLWGHDCPNCEIFKRSLPRLLTELAQLPVDFVALNVYEHPEVARRFAVYGIPHFLLFWAGKKLGKMSEFRGEGYFLTVVREQLARAASER